MPIMTKQKTAYDRLEMLERHNKRFIELFEYISVQISHSAPIDKMALLIEMNKCLGK